MGTLTYKKNTFEYFRRLKPTIANGNVLDYGSNYGTFLESSKKQFPEDMYTGIDVDQEAIDEGKRLFPNASFICYDGYNAVYNSSGKESVIDLPDTYDTIVSYSVFSHTSKEDMLEKINWLYTSLKPNGTILATWLDVDVRAVKDFFYRKRLMDYGSCDKIITDDFIYLNDNRCSKIVESDIQFLLAFYKKDFLKDLLSNYNVTLVDSFPDISGCFQSCMIIQKN